MRKMFKSVIVLMSCQLGIFNIFSPNISSIASIPKSGEENNFDDKVKKINKNILASPIGDAEENRIKENRFLAHSRFIPTGLFAIEGASINVKIDYRYDFDLKNFSIFVGQWGFYQQLNQQSSGAPSQYKLKNWNQSIIIKKTGMVYISNESLDTEFVVNLEIDRAINVPTFEVDKTGNFDFASQLENWFYAPFVELIGKKIFATLQMPIIKDKIKNQSPQFFNFNDLIHYWDRVVELSNQASGLSSSANNHNLKFKNKIHIANPDRGYGYAYATHNYIAFQIDTKAAQELIGDKTFFNNWGLWHEIGHTYQNPDYLFNGFVETTVNINSFYVEEKLKFSSRYLARNDDINIMKTYLASDNKNIETLNVWVKLGIFLQLHMAYGSDFFPLLNGSYRTLKKEQKPQTNQQKYQLFIIMCSKLVNRNLIPFFNKWGIYANEFTKKTLYNFSELKTPIWLNIIDKNKIIKDDWN